MDKLLWLYLFGDGLPYFVSANIVGIAKEENLNPHLQWSTGYPLSFKNTDWITKNT